MTRLSSSPELTRIGSGPPVLMLMPHSTGPRGTAAFTSQLAGSFEVLGVKPDKPESPTEITIESMAQQALNALDAADIQNVNIFAHSTGCGPATWIAAEHPERIRRLVLCNPWTHADAHLTSMQRLRICAANTLPADQYARFNASILFPPDYRRHHSDTFSELARQAKDNNAVIFGRRLEAILAYDARVQYPKIRCPALVISAFDDQLMPHWFGTEAAQLIASATHRELANGGHMLPETCAQTIASEVVGFLQ